MQTPGCESLFKATRLPRLTWPVGDLAKATEGSVGMTMEARLSADLRCVHDRVQADSNFCNLIRAAPFNPAVAAPLETAIPGELGPVRAAAGPRVSGKLNGPTVRFIRGMADAPSAACQRIDPVWRRCNQHGGWDE